MSSRLFYLFILLSGKTFCYDHAPILSADQAAIWLDYSQRFEQKYHFPTLNIQNIQEDWCTNQTSILHFFLEDSAIYLYLIFEEHISMLTLDASTPLEQDIDELIRSIKAWPATHQSRHLFIYQQSAYQLYQALLEPVASILPPKIRIIPDDLLSKLPFEVLLYKALSHSDTPLSHYPYLIKKHQISYMNVIQLAASAPEAHSPTLKNRVLAYAPIFPLDEVKAERTGLRPLYHNKQEVEAISQLFPTDIRWGKTATIDNFLREAPMYRILHLATHTQWPSGQEYHQLAFTPQIGGSARHLLVDSTLLAKKFHAEMLVLSACESGTGQITYEKNGLTLAAAFAQTGIRSLITTLWRIEDKATADFMVIFYENLKQGKAKDAALRYTKLHFIEHQTAYYAHPFYWANCVVYGDTKPIKSCTKLSQSLVFVLIAIVGCCFFLAFLGKRHKSFN